MTSDPWESSRPSHVAVKKESALAFPVAVARSSQILRWVLLGCATTHFQNRTLRKDKASSSIRPEVACGRLGAFFAIAPDAAELAAGRLLARCPLLTPFAEGLTLSTALLRYQKLEAFLRARIPSPQARVWPNLVVLNRSSHNSPL